MPLGSPIGSGQGIGSPSQAAYAMEIGAAGILVNTAVAKAQNSPQMAYAMKLGVKSGRAAFLAGQIQSVQSANPSSTTVGLLV
eukprot:scaffold51549_cov1860-Isochrysis_galbana.AAC.3